MDDSVKPRCARDDCDVLVKARGLCYRHYNEVRTAGRICSVNGCEKPIHTRSYCTVHYHRWQNYGDPGEATLRRNPTRPCKVEGCDLTAASRHHLCRKHAVRKRLYGDPDGLFRTHKLCGTCGSPAVSGNQSNDYCREHYVDHVKALIVQGRLKGSRSPAGYVYHQIFKVRYAEHAVIMEHILGRPLERGENVHHRNGRKDDNRPENLELWVKPQPAGQRAEDLVAWVVDHYPDLAREALEKRASP